MYKYSALLFLGTIHLRRQHIRGGGVKNWPNLPTYSSNHSSKKLPTVRGRGQKSQRFADVLDGWCLTKQPINKLNQFSQWQRLGMKPCAISPFALTNTTVGGCWRTLWQHTNKSNDVTLLLSLFLSLFLPWVQQSRKQALKAYFFDLYMLCPCVAGP